MYKFGLVILMISTGFITAEDRKLEKPQASNEVDGLKLTPSMQVPYDEGFVTIFAECKGSVKWLVLSTSSKVKFRINSASPNEIDIAIPPREGGITVFAIGVVDGKLTEFARTDITIKGPAPPPPDPTPPDPVPIEVKFPLHLSIIHDPANRPPQLGPIINDLDLRNYLGQKNIKLREYSVNDPLVKAKKFDAAISKYGLPLVILQDDTGKGLKIQALPGTPNELRRLVDFVIEGKK